MMPIVSKFYCSPSEVVLVIRQRPKVTSGGGFTVADCSNGVVFRVDGCGILGKKQEMILRDANGNALLLIKRQVLYFSQYHQTDDFFLILLLFLFLFFFGCEGSSN